MATTQASHSRDRSITQSTMAPMLDFQLAPSMAPFGSHPMPLSQPWEMPMPTTLSRPESTANALSKDVALSIRRERELLEAAVPITYTPATHRISKAKKGKRVHFCQFPGCPKVFTRAEHRRYAFTTSHRARHTSQREADPHHRRRHELNHNPRREFMCSVEGCGKGFHRHDLLARHIEKQPSSSRRRKTSRASTVSDKTASNPTPIPNHRLTPVRHTLPAATTTTTTTIPTPTPSESLPLPPTSLPQSYAGDFSAPFWGQAGKPLQKNQTVPQTPYHLVDDVGPILLARQFALFLVERQPISRVLTIPRHRTVPRSRLCPTAHHLPHSHGILPRLDSPGSGGHPAPADVALHNLWVRHPPDSSTPLQPGWSRMVCSATRACFPPGVVSGDNGMAIIDLAKWQDCFECYWQHFHPLFPIVHRASFFTTKPSPLMAGAMVAIGSQYDRRPNSKEYSLALLEACQKILSKFIQDSHWASRNPLAAYQSLPQNPSPDDITNAHKSWVEHETRRRVLQAAFILEVQQSVLFQQPLATFLQSNLDPVMREYRISPKVDLPFPCNSELWECGDINQWTKHAKGYEALVSSTARERIIKSTDGPGFDLDPFQASLIFSQTLPNTSDLEEVMAVFVEKVAGKIDLAGNYGQNTRSSYIRFMYHAHLAAKHIPLQAILTVSGESWLFNRKVCEAEFQTAKERVRTWASNTTEVKTALWHAIHVLQYTVHHSDCSKRKASVQGPRRPSMDQLQNGYLNSPAPSAVSTNSQDRTATGPTPPFLHNNNTTSFQPPAGPLTMLQSNWVLYICLLICYAYENRATLSNNQLITANPSPVTPISTAPPMTMHQYISTFLSSPSFSSLHQFLHPPGPHPITPGHDLTAVIEHIRFTISRSAGGNWNGAGLLNEAERVLVRLIEQQQRAQQQHFQHFQRQRQHSHQAQLQPAWEFVDSGF
ncbi:predicted protein [Uncinocarpus reesii 1704]|uniref:C2H2-type domain-containing protein n=1 Tax=Uncinocarpus reesii (strain UAMH 1704) TaxID=336963 RepID=C4JWG9_UNCRE|nr:uncharacterized protein UREG_06911 [Uncinocarpus reesii 1704]EEP82046.1 predicted protein [Uncinocarpus reesii 1704]